MNARQELNAYIRTLERRLRLGTLTRGTAIVASAALAATIVLVLAISALAFSQGSITGARFALFATLAFAVVFALFIPLSHLTRHRAARKAEEIHPAFQQRLETFVDRDRTGDSDGGKKSADPFLDLLAADALEVANGAAPEAVAPNAAMLAGLGVTVVSLAVLFWMIAARPGFLGYGAHLLWSGARAEAAPLSEVRVSPGDATVRRRTDQLITAQVPGILTPQVLLYARYQSASSWEQVAMQPRSGDSLYQFVLTGVPENVEYYVEAGPRRSRHFNLRVVDLPSVKQIKVTYHFPSWTGMKDAVEESGGDLRALEGTRAELEVMTDRPLKDGLLVLDGGKQITLSGGSDNRYQGAIAVERDGVYHVAAVDGGQAVRLSEDYFIEARKANPPEVTITRPGGDYRASPIEEVTVAIKAQDEFGVKDLDLHYSVNGGPENTVRLLKVPGEKQAEGSTVLALEDFKLVPGDLVSIYATAKDARSQSQTDMAFIQVDPFEREFSQSQQSGGGGGGGGGQGVDPTEISRREKEMIAATFRQQSDKKATEKQASDTAKFLSDAQSTLRNQSLSLAGRLQARELTRENREFSKFQQEMTAAAEAMSPASQRLQQQKWQDAIPEEQKALQHLLRAEATFRQIEVAFGSRGGGGGGGGAGRDLASLFDLELDTQKNQYETQQAVSSADQRAQDINEALQKLDELARRQEELARRQRENSAQGFEQRWQQEMLQREAEQLQRQVEQLTRDRQNGQSSNGQQSSSPGSSGSASSQGSQASQGGQGSQGAQGQSQSQSSVDARARAQQQAAQALDRLRQAQDDMRRAASDPQRGADARLAAERLREAGDLLGGIQSQAASGRLGSIAREADRLAGEEKNQADQVNRLKERSSTPQPGAQSAARDVQQLASDRQRLADDLSNLQQDMRNTARELDASQRAASAKLREALDGLDQADLETRLQRTADWLRSGYDPNRNGTESQIASSLQRLSDQVHQAQQALVAGGQRQNGDNTESALNGLERLRRQIEALGAQGNQGNQGTQPGQAPPRETYQTGSLSRDGQPGQSGQQGQSGGQQGGQNAQGGQQGGQNAQGGPVGQGARNGDDFFGPFGQRAPGGGYRDGWVTDNVDIGNNARPGAPRTAAPAQRTPAVDTEQTIQQGVNELTQLRRATQNDPAMQKQIQELISAMEHLDLKRFPGNPAMVEELHQRILSGVDTLELQLRRSLDDKTPGQIRSTDSAAAPPGYKDAVADYFRRLSQTTSSKSRDKDKDQRD
jgi:hypothetical protein